MKFKSDIEVQAGLKDSSGSIGASGQILSSTNGNVSWVTPTVNTVARDVQNEVKAGVAINKGQAVYVTGADGTNIIVGLASNTSEATSSKTLGLLNATVAVNGFADVVQIGRLSGLNTIGAVVGDPVWLGTNGNLIYGLANKPYAPAHLVFIGVVTRVNANNGEIFITVQNGFELKEIHDVDIITNVPINGDVLGYDGTLWVNKTIAEWLGFTPANASGTTNYVSKFTGTNSLGDSQIFDNGTGVGIGTTSPSEILHLQSSQPVIRITKTGVLNWYAGNVTGNNYTIYPDSNNIFAFNITSGGNVGIGTSSPTYKLQVVNSGNTLLQLNGNNTAGTIDTGFTISADDSKNIYLYQRENASTVFGTNNTEKMRITSGGNVGIGTTDVDSRFKAELINVASLRVAYNGTSVNYYDANENIFRSGSGSERMRITSSGNVGIGTTTPGSKLEISDSLPFINVLGTSSGGVGVFGYRIKDSGNNLVDFTYNSGTGENKIGGLQSYVFPTFYSGGSERMRIASNGAIKFNSYGSGSFTGTATQRLAVDSLGNVIEIPIGGGAVDGSGTTNYVTKWTDADTIGNSQIFDNGANVGIGTNIPSAAFQVGNGTGLKNILISGSGNNLGLGGLSVTFLGFTTGTISTVNTSGAVPLGVGTRSTQPLVLGTNNAERMRIDSSGNVGIGTTSPTLGKLVSKSSGYQFIAEPTDTTTYGYLGIGHFTNGTFIGTTAGTDNASDLLRFGTSGTERMRITSTGNVGIGTTSPLQKLHVEGLSYFGSDIFTLNNGGIFFSGNNSYQRGIYSNTSGLTLQTLGSPKVTITDGGNVGIGTTSPTEKLDVSVTKSYNQSADIGIALGGTDNGFVDNFSTSSWRQFVSGNASGQSLKFDGFVRSVGWVERMRITSSGNVGIGTTSPGQKLDVIGNIQASGFVGSGTGSNQSFLQNGNLGFYNAAASSKYIQLVDDSSTINAIGFSKSGSASTTWFPSGNVGIGTTNPTFAKLKVSGASASGAIISEDTSGTTSFVRILGDISSQNLINWQSGTALRFATSTQDYASFSEAMRITSSGNVGIGTASPNASAILHLRSTTQGFLPPVMRTGERNGISSPAIGLMIFNEEDDAVQVYTGEGWRTLAWL